MKWRCTHCNVTVVTSCQPTVCTGCGGSTLVRIKGPVGRFFDEFRKSFVLHAITAHFPNALFPSAVALILYAGVTEAPCMAEAAFFMTLLAVLFLPLTLLSGLRDWRRHYGGKRAPIFTRKITISLILLVAGITALVIHPKPDHPNFPVLSWLFISLLALMLGLTVLLGHYGGKLVFQNRR